MEWQILCLSLAGGLGRRPDLRITPPRTVGASPCHAPHNLATIPLQKIAILIYNGNPSAWRTVMDSRTNEEWLAQLTATEQIEVQEAAIEALRQRLQRGIYY